MFDDSVKECLEINLTNLRYEIDNLYEAIGKESTFDCKSTYERLSDIATDLESLLY